jgi:hypothetical protein
MLFMRHVFDPHRPIEVKRMAVKLVAREGSKDAQANSKGEGGVGPSGSLVPCPPPPATATSVDVDAQNRKNEEISVQVKSKMPDGVIDFDADCGKDPFQVGIYAEDMETLTLSRFILETSLMNCDFIDVKDSMMAASC